MRSNAWTTAGLGAAAVFSLTVWPGLISSAQQGAPRVTVYKSPTCGCCSNWVEHMKKNGFLVTAQDVDDIDAVKMKHGVPPAASSCHTAIVDGYVVEGHVPADS